MNKKIIISTVVAVALVPVVHTIMTQSISYDIAEVKQHVAPIAPVKSDMDIKFENTRKLVDMQLSLLENVKATEKTLQKALAIHSEVITEYCEGMEVLDIHSPATTYIYNELSNVEVECN